MSRKMIGMLTVALFLLAASLVCLSTGDSIGKLNERETAVQRLTAQLALLDDAAMRRQRNLARWYNWNLTAKQADAGFEKAYGGILSFQENIMGYLEIPEMEQRLPIYHGVEEASQIRGAGHLPGSAFPIGGIGNHTVLMGTADFGKLRVGDLFYIHILDETLVYVVEQVREVSPGQTAGLSPSAGEDLCTLVTSKGYGSDIRKIMVRGSRAALEREREAIAVLAQKPSVDKILVVAAVGTALITLLLPVVACGISKGTLWAVGKINCRRLTKNV